MTNRTTILTILACALMAGHSLPARGQSVANDGRLDTAQETVHLGDLDLASHSGQAAARLRLLEAVHAACDSIYADAGNQAPMDGCRSKALADTQPQLTRLIQQARGNRIELARQ